MNYPIDYREAHVINLAKPIRWINSTGDSWHKRPRARTYINSMGGDVSDVLRKKLVVMHFVTAHEANPDNTPADLIFVWIGTEDGDVGIYWNWREYPHVNLTAGQMAEDYIDFHWACRDVGLDDGFIAGIAAHVQALVDDERSAAGL